MRILVYSRKQIDQFKEVGLFQEVSQDIKDQHKKETGRELDCVCPHVAYVYESKPLRVK